MHSFRLTEPHVPSWQCPDAQIDAGLSFEHYKQFAQTAKRGLFDAAFLADSPGVWGGTLESQFRNSDLLAWKGYKPTG